MNNNDKRKLDRKIKSGLALSWLGIILACISLTCTIIRLFLR